jgi:D-alanine-D-alanine ligase
VPSFDPVLLAPVVILAGGASGERSVSLAGGAAVAQALRARGVETLLLDPAEAGFVPRLLAARPRSVFVLVHGRGGEDGSLQGLLETLDLPYTGSGVLASALAFDKMRSKWIWQAHGLPLAEGTALRRGEPLPSAERFAGPVCVKPAADGSSLGVSRVARPEELPAALERAWAHGPVALIEEWLPGEELTVSLLGERTLPAVCIRPRRPFYDYVAKYEDAGTEYLCPAPLDPALEAELATLARRAFALLGARGWGRVDFRLGSDGRPRLLELNTVPGMTSHSLLPMSARAAGLDFADLCLAVLAEIPRSDGDG